MSKMTEQDNTTLGLRQKIALAVAKADVDTVMELIQAEVLKARIDELENIKIVFTKAFTLSVIRYSDGNQEQPIYSRIAELQNQLKKSKGE